MVSMGRWWHQNFRTYVGNAGSVRDYRAQLRGKRSQVFFGFYLGLIILLTLLIYYFGVNQGVQTVTALQSNLYSFYVGVVSILETMVVLVAPVVAASSIMGEKNRKALDLVFSAPVTPKYYLVGKVLASYRYLIMLIALSLPITASAVVLGGTTWREVLITYFILSMRALLLICISLPIAMMARKIVSAIVWSYLATALFSIAVYTYTVLSSFSYGMTSELSMIGYLAPYLTISVPESNLQVLGVAVPSWLIMGLVMLFLSKLFTHGAGVVASPIGSATIKSFRIQVPLIAGIIAFSIIAALYSNSYSTSGLSFLSNPAGFVTGKELGLIAVWMTSPLFLFITYMSVWNRNADSRYNPQGGPTIAGLFKGGARVQLAFLLLILLAIGTGICGAALITGHPEAILFWPWYLWAAAFWYSMFAMGWLVSTYSKSGVETARKSYIAFGIMLLLLPWPILVMLGSSSTSINEKVFAVYPLSTLMFDKLSYPIIHGAVLAVGGTILLFWGERRRKSIVVSSKEQTSDVAASQ